MYEKLIAFLQEHEARFELIDHPEEGRTEIVSPMRGNEVKDAAKCMVIMVKVGKKVTRYVLAVVPGDRKVDLQAVRALHEGTYVSFASPGIAEELTGCVPGTVLPFSFNERLQLVVDPEVRTPERLYFNAARLDRSMALSTEDYFRIAEPAMETIAQPAGA